MLESLEKHKKECEGDELSWTTECFDRVSEELSVLRGVHPEVDVCFKDTSDENVAEECLNVEEKKESIGESLSKMTSQAVSEVCLCEGVDE